MNGNPDPTNWGEPQADFQGCDIDAHFRNHQIIFDTTFCGDWAASAWAADPVCGKKATTCNEFVAQNPEAFMGA
jgi:hypothetical protein